MGHKLRNTLMSMMLKGPRVTSQNRQPVAMNVVWSLQKEDKNNYFVYWKLYKWVSHIQWTNEVKFNLTLKMLIMLFM